MVGAFAVGIGSEIQPAQAQHGGGGPAPGCPHTVSGNCNIGGNDNPGGNENTGGNSQNG